MSNLLLTVVSIFAGLFGLGFLYALCVSLFIANPASLVPPRQDSELRYMGNDVRGNAIFLTARGEVVGRDVFYMGRDERGNAVYF